MDEKRTRSPRYPSLNLQEALDKVRLVYEKEHTHRASREVIARDMGYTGISGASASVIASIRQFGLLESAGDGLRVSSDAMTVLELPTGDAERSSLLEKLARTPPLFAELFREFGERLPSDENLRLFVIRSGFNSHAANQAIKAFKETAEILNVLSHSAGNAEEPSESETSNAVQVGGQSTSRPIRGYGSFSRAISVEPIAEQLQYRLSDDCRVQIRFSGSVTREAIRKLIAYLELGIDDFPSKSVLHDDEANVQEIAEEN